MACVGALRTYGAPAPLTLVVRLQQMRVMLIVTAMIGLIIAGLVMRPEPMSGANAVHAAGPAAASLGFDLNKLSPPTASGSSTWGTLSFHWEAASPDGQRHVLDYLVLDESLCWTSVSGSDVRPRGCVAVKLPQ
jgi:hypothetical protein